MRTSACEGMESFLKNLDDEIEWENGVRKRCIRDLQLEKSNVKEDFMRYLATEKQKLDKACALVKDLTDASNEREEVILFHFYLY